MKRRWRMCITSLIIFCAIFMTQICVNAKSINVNEQKDFFEYKVARHAMGEYKGAMYNNHELALKKSLKKGFKFIEIDLILTTDDVLVCSHGWNESTCEYTGIEYKESYAEEMTYKQFMNLRIQGKYKPMSAKKWAKYVKKNDDILWELDLRTLDGQTAKKTAEAIIDLFDSDSQYLDRFLIQVGSEEMFYAINDVYEFKNYQYFIHKAELDSIESILEFCTDNNIKSMAVNVNYMNEKIVNKIKENEMKILCYTIDDKIVAQEMLKMGADCICSNTLSEKNLEIDEK